MLQFFLDLVKDRICPFILSTRRFQPECSELQSGNAKQKPIPVHGAVLWLQSNDKPSNADGPQALA